VFVYAVELKKVVCQVVIIVGHGRLEEATELVDIKDRRLGHRPVAHVGVQLADALPNLVLFVKEPNTMVLLAVI